MEQGLKTDFDDVLQHDPDAETPLEGEQSEQA